MRDAKLKQGKPSWTAEVSASYRAAESDRPESEQVCYDPISGRFLGFPFNIIGMMPPFLRRMLARPALWYAERLTPGNPGYVVARTRYIDDRLTQSIEDGINQLVILGAGYDTRAYRIDALQGRVKVFEVDHPATQQLKIAKVRRLLGSPPDNVVYVGVDFDKESLGERMFESGYDSSLKTLFIWEGVIPYITAEGVDDTLAFAAKNSGEGSSIIFDYIYSSVVDGDNESEVARKWRGTLQRLGEPFTFGIEEGSCERFLLDRGFGEVTETTVESLKDAYFQGRSRNRRLFPFVAIVHATVKTQ
jgi:methyltransferase (TIGR00027 family)